MYRTLAAIGAPMAMVVALTAQGAPPTQSILGPKLEAKATVADAIPGVVAAGEKVALIQDGLKGSDAVVGLPDGTAVFVEQNSPRIVRINADDSLTTLVEEPATTRALGVDSKGRLIGLVLTSAAAKADHVRVLYGPDTGTILATDVEGKALFQANDFVVTRKDAIYMTDAGVLMKPPLTEPTWIYLLPPRGTPKRVADKIIMPNGIGLSPDDRTLYVNDSRGDYLVAFDVQRDGSLSNRRNFAKYHFDDEMRKTFPYLADALCVDADGRVYVAMPLGVHVFSPKGEFLGRIPVTKKTQNLAFAGRDRRTLYIMSQGSVWKVRTLSRGPRGRAK